MKTFLICPALALALMSAPSLHSQTPAANNTKTSQLDKSSNKLPSDKYEQPQYKVIEQLDAIEIRQYQPMLMAEVDVEGERSSAINAGFRLLAGYIFGGNTTRTSIAMTSPVTQTDLAVSTSTEPNKGDVERKGIGEKIAMTSPVTLVPVEGVAPQNEKTPQRWTVAFMMPSQYTLDTLPKPNNAQVRFRVSEPERRVAIRFSGFSSKANLAKHREALETFIAARKLKTVGEPMLAFYDDPFTAPWNRRNEWWVGVAPQ